MITLIRRALVASVTPRPIPTDDDLANALGLVRVQTYTRKPPTNPKREALHDQLRAERDRPAGHRVQA